MRITSILRTLCRVIPSLATDVARSGCSLAAEAVEDRKLTAWDAIHRLAPLAGWSECSVHGWHHKEHGVCPKCIHYKGPAMSFSSFQEWKEWMDQPITVSVSTDLDGKAIARAVINDKNRRNGHG